MAQLNAQGDNAMAKNFHEHYALGAAPMPSDRSTGLVFAAVAVIVAYLWRANTTVVVAALLAAGALLLLSLAAPSLLRPLNVLWFRIGLMLHRVVNPLVMLVMFAAIFLPAGLIMRIWHDPLRSRRAAPGASYWIDRSGMTSSMSNQF
jgi:hypothetical protein